LPCSTSRRASRAKYIFDLATAVNALSFDGERYDLKRFEALIGGYESLRTLSLAEWDAFPNELRFSALLFTVMRLNDFFLHPVDESQRASKDFREFYERLRILRRETESGMEGLLMAMATGYDYRKYQKVRASALHGGVLRDDRAEGSRLLHALRAPSPSLLRQSARRLHSQSPDPRRQQARAAVRGVRPAAAVARAASPLGSR
jgi:hypothetical protein